MINYLDEMYDYAHDHRSLLSMMIELTTICNEKCVHCYIPEHTNIGLKTDDIKRVVKEFREMGGLNLSLTGGEIFLRSDIYEIIEYARNLKLRVFLLTNGTLLGEKEIQLLKKYNIAELSISVYSLDDTIHDSITGVKGSLKKTLQAVELAIQNGIRVTIKTPLMESNKWSFRDLKKYCKDRSIEYIASCIIFSKSNGDANVKRLSINENDQRVIAREVEEIEPNGRRNNYEEACGSLKYTLAIDSFGNVYPCNSFFYKIGNIQNADITTLWNSKVLKSIQNIKKIDLTDCKCCQLRNKCTRCPGLAYLEDKTLLGCSSTARKNVSMRL